jgi:hypothetical protein
MFQLYLTQAEMPALQPGYSHFLSTAIWLLQMILILPSGLVKQQHPPHSESTLQNKEYNAMYVLPLPLCSVRMTHLLL